MHTIKCSSYLARYLLECISAAAPYSSHGALRIHHISLDGNATPYEMHESKQCSKWANKNHMFYTSLLYCVLSSLTFLCLLHAPKRECVERIALRLFHSDTKIYIFTAAYFIYIYMHKSNGSIRFGAS